MLTLRNKTKSVKVLKTMGMPTLRVLPGYNYVDYTKEELKKYSQTEVNKAMIKESIEFVDFTLSGKDADQAKNALEVNEKLNKAQRVIDKQNKQILEKDKENDSQSKMIKEQGDLIVEMRKQIEKLEKKIEKKVEKKDKK